MAGVIILDVASVTRPSALRSAAAPRERPLINTDEDVICPRPAAPCLRDVS